MRLLTADGLVDFSVTGQLPIVPIKQKLEGRVLVTGGTGSFGRAFIEHILRLENPAQVIVFSRDELKQEEMRRGEFTDERLRWFIGDVRDKDRLTMAFQGVDIVVHAAALKQIPAIEYNPFEAVQTNILGARNVIHAALDTGVKKVIALSSDKAVNPISLYGATKLIMEKLMVQANSYRGHKPTLFSCVRYGNVIGSRGSVVPLFLKQKESGTLTVTDPRMTRFWITLQQGVDFVLSSLFMMQGGEIFVPKIPSMKIVDLAPVIAPEASVKVTGIRPGEKLHETLLSADEARHSYDLGDRYIIMPEFPFWSLAVPEGGQALIDGWSYTSDINSDWLTIDDLRALL